MERKGNYREQLAIYEYITDVLGNGKDNGFYGSTLHNSVNTKRGDFYSEDDKQAMAAIWRFAIENLLHIKPEEAGYILDKKLVRALHLNTTEFVFKDNFACHFGYFYILAYAYPDIYSDPFRNETMDAYFRVAKKGRYINSKINYKYPNEFFTDIMVSKRMYYICNYLVETYLGNIASSKELYDFFADEKKARAFLVSHSLASASNRQVYSAYTSALSFFHYNVSEKFRNDLYYFQILLKQEIKKG